MCPIRTDIRKVRWSNLLSIRRFGSRIAHPARTTTAWRAPAWRPPHVLQVRASTRSSRTTRTMPTQSFVTWFRQLRRPLTTLHQMEVSRANLNTINTTIQSIQSIQSIQPVLHWRLSATSIKGPFRRRDGPDPIRSTKATCPSMESSLQRRSEAPLAFAHCPDSQEHLANHELRSAAYGARVRNALGAGLQRKQCSAVTVVH